MQRNATTGADTLDMADALPARGDIRHYLPGKVLGSYFYLGDKPFGVEPGFLGVRIDRNLLGYLKEIELVPQDWVDRYAVNPAAVVLQVKNVIDRLHEDFQREVVVDQTAPVTEKQFNAALKQQLEAKTGSQVVSKMKMLMALAAKIKREGMRPTFSINTPVLWLIKQDYNDDHYYPSKDRLAAVNSIQSIASPMMKSIKLSLYQAGRSLHSSRVNENKNALLENLANDMASQVMLAQEQRLLLKRNLDGTLSFLTACRWEPQIEMLEHCLAGSSRANKYYVNVRRHYHTREIQRGYDLAIVDKVPDKGQCEPNQYFLVYDAKAKSDSRWTLYHTNSGGVLLKTTVNNAPALTVEKAYYRYLSAHTNETLLKTDCALEFANFVERLPKMTFAAYQSAHPKAKYEEYIDRFPHMEFHRGPVLLRSSAGFYTPDSSLENLGYLAPLVVLLADNDTVGSVGQNKARVRNQFFGLDFGHALRGETNHLVEIMHNDLSFNDPAYKNIGSLFYDNQLSDRLCGLYLLYKLMGKSLREMLFPDREGARINLAISHYSRQYPEFKQKYEALTDGGLFEIVTQYKNRLFLLKEQQQEPAIRQECDVYIAAVEGVERLIRGSLIGMMRKCKDCMVLTPDEANVLHRLEKLVSPTSLTSENGNVLLRHLRLVDVPNKPRIAWKMSIDNNGHVRLTAPVADESHRKRLLSLLQDYALLHGKKYGIVLDPEHLRQAKDEQGHAIIEIHLQQEEMANWLQFLDEERMKLAKPTLAKELDVTPADVRERALWASTQPIKPDKVSPTQSSFFMSPPSPDSEKRLEIPAFPESDEDDLNQSLTTFQQSCLTLCRNYLTDLIDANLDPKELKKAYVEFKEDVLPDTVMIWRDAKGVGHHVDCALLKQSQFAKTSPQDYEKVSLVVQLLSLLTGTFSDPARQAITSIVQSEPFQKTILTRGGFFGRKDTVSENFYRSLLAVVSPEVTPEFKMK